MDLIKNRRMKRKIIYISILLLLTALAFSGCDFKNANANTVEITDMLGRKVLIPEDPQRIAVLDPLASYAVIMLDQGDKIVATVGGVQRDLLLQVMSPSLVGAAVVKEEGAINAESVLRLKADLIFIRSEDYAKKTERTKLDKLGIPYLVVDYGSLEDQCRAVRLVGEVFGREEKAEEYIGYYHETIRLVSEIVENIPDNERPTLYHSINTAITTDAAGSLGAQWIAVTGAKNVSLNVTPPPGLREYITTIEEIFVWNPDIIICNESGINEYILSHSVWQGLRAVREGKVYQMPIGISRMGHFNSIETPLAIWWLTDLIYPAHLADFDFRKEMKVFYARFFDHELDEETIDAILSGQGIRSSGVKGP
ncbi:MAG: ABC transporter substrate-binding protein [Clostridiales bacterium]|nr:ABC transporter substrate-binding protein [Clostridiales bacterium]